MNPEKSVACGRVEFDSKQVGERGLWSAEADDLEFSIRKFRESFCDSVESARRTQNGKLELCAVIE